MCAKAGDHGVGFLACELEFDVAVELVETGLAAHIGAGRSEQTSQGLVRDPVESSLRLLPCVAARPVSVRCWRSLQRASCKVFVERAAGCVQSLGEDVDRYAVEGECEELQAAKMEGAFPIRRVHPAYTQSLASPIWRLKVALRTGE